MIATTYWGGWMRIGAQRWWLCQDYDALTCLYPEDDDGPPSIRLACDSEAEFLELAAEAGICVELLCTVQYRI